MSFALVLALVAGAAVNAAPPRPVAGEQSDSLGSGTCLLLQGQRSQKRLEPPRRDVRRFSHERPLALPPPPAVAAPAIRIAIVETLRPALGRDRTPGPIAVARPPPRRRVTA